MLTPRTAWLLLGLSIAPLAGLFTGVTRPIAAAQPPAVAQPAAAAQIGAPEVHLSLVCEAPVVRAGGAFEVAALIRLEPDWHVYWKHAGDVGSPTKATLSAPEGFAIEGPLFPAPEAIEAEPDLDFPGDDLGLVSFGYHDPAVLFFRVTPPADLAAGTEFELGVEAGWLVCKQACFMGGDSAGLALRIGGPGAAGASEGEVARHEVAQHLDRARARLPIPFDGEASWTAPLAPDAEGKRFRGGLSLAVEGELLAIFDDPSGGLRTKGKRIEGQRALLELESRKDPFGGELPATARGLLAVRRSAGEVFLEYEVAAAP